MSTKGSLLRSYLLTGKGITRLQALGELKIYNVTAEIARLRSAGYNIKAIRRTDAAGKPYTEWKMKKSEKEMVRGNPPFKPENFAVTVFNRMTGDLGTYLLEKT